MRERIREVLARYKPEQISDNRLTPAAVLLLLYERDGSEHLLFQVRTCHVEYHKGEISLPGGARDPEDESLLTTALRETEEEIGVASVDVEVLGRLDDVATNSNFVMSPFVGALTRPYPYPFRFAEREVAELLEVPVERLLCGEAWEWTALPGAPAMPVFRHGKHHIFGATARVVVQFVRLLEADGVLSSRGQVVEG